MEGLRIILARKLDDRGLINLGRSRLEYLANFKIRELHGTSSDSVEPLQTTPSVTRALDDECNALTHPDAHGA
jgi:hypothetical protein